MQPQWHHTEHTPLGVVHATYTVEGITSIDILDQFDAPLATLTPAQQPAWAPVLGLVLQQLSAGTPAAHQLPVVLPTATPFATQVLQYLQTIPHGSQETYKTIAEQLGTPTAHRAVANACGANTIALLIPCHRVVRSDGTVGGYKWGTKRKTALLAAETSSAAT
jgi:O-6-methylguanine DNA methyltransferase